MKYSLQENMLVFNILLYVFTIALTLLFSGLSFKYFETYFLKLKSKFEVVKSSRKIDWGKKG